MINLYKLIYLFPAYYKEKDTYKDADGKGLLERFLEICGEYFQDEVTTDIDNILDILDIETTQEMYINFLWEFFGKIPYGYGALYKANNFQTTNINTPEVWDLDLDTIPRARYRDLLKYTISLYKIRGTHDFYNILLGFYNMSVVLTDPSDSSGGAGPTRGTPLYDSGLFYDQLNDYDVSQDCLACTAVTMVITSQTTLTTEEEDRVLLLLNRFRPVNVISFSRDNVTFTT